MLSGSTDNVASSYLPQPGIPDSGTAIFIHGSASIVSEALITEVYVVQEYDYLDI